jgi:hypothetical protein
MKQEPPQETISIENNLEYFGMVIKTVLSSGAKNITAKKLQSFLKIELGTARLVLKCLGQLSIVSLNKDEESCEVLIQDRLQSLDHLEYKECAKETKAVEEPARQNFTVNCGEDHFARDYLFHINHMELKLRSLNRWLSDKRNIAIAGNNITYDDKSAMYFADQELGKLTGRFGLVDYKLVKVETEQGSDYGKI